MIPMRDCETRLDILETGMGNLRILQGYINADYVGDLDQRRSTMGYIFMVAECAISWTAKLQDRMALSLTEAKFIATIEASNEALCLRELVEAFGIIQDSVLVHCDNQSTFHLANDHRYHKRMKHMDVRYHKIR